MRDLDALVNAFAENVALQTDAIWRADARTANKHAKRVNAAFKELTEEGNTGRDTLARLFQHERPDVRVVAAAFLLRHRTAEAQAVLRAIARSGPSYVAFCAEQALERWEEGTSALDPP